MLSLFNLDLEFVILIHSLKEIMRGQHTVAVTANLDAFPGHIHCDET